MRGIRGCMRAIAVLGGIGISAWLGCSMPEGRRRLGHRRPLGRRPPVQAKPRADVRHRERSPNPAVAKRQAVTRATLATSNRKTRPVSSTAAAIERVLAVIQDSVAFAPTTVVWFLDTSPSAMNWGSELHADVRRFYAGDVLTGAWCGETARPHQDRSCDHWTGSGDFPSG